MRILSQEKMMIDNWNKDGVYYTLTDKSDELYELKAQQYGNDATVALAKAMPWQKRCFLIQTCGNTSPMEREAFMFRRSC